MTLTVAGSNEHTFSTEIMPSDIGMKRQFPNNRDSIIEILKIVCIHALGFGFKETGKLELLVEEAVTNVIDYSGSSSLEISLQSLYDRPGIQICIRDQGIAFNPLTHDISAIDGRTSRGYGIQLIRALADDLKYHREQGCNILTLTKYAEFLDLV